MGGHSCDVCSVAPLLPHPPPSVPAWAVQQSAVRCGIVREGACQGGKGRGTLQCRRESLLNACDFERSGGRLFACSSVSL